MPRQMLGVLAMLKCFILCVVDHQIEMFVCNAGLVSAVSKVIFKVEIETEDG